jgi:hypothetical protein
MLELQSTINILNWIDGPRPYQEYIVALFPGTVALALTGVLWSFRYRFARAISHCLLGLSILYLLAVGKTAHQWGIAWNIDPMTILPWMQYTALVAWYVASILLFMACKRLTRRLISRQAIND